MNSLTKTLGTIGLATILGSTGCESALREERTLLDETTVNGNRVRILKEVIDWDQDMYRLEFYGKDEKADVVVRGNVYPTFVINTNNGLKYFNRSHLDK